MIQVQRYNTANICFYGKILSGTSFSTFYDGIKWIKQRLYYSFYTKDQNRQTIMGNYHSLPAYDPCVMKMGR